MSLMSLLNADLSTSSSTTSPQVQQAIQMLAAKTASQATTTTSATGKSSVQITIEAKRAANAKADGSKDATALATELRAGLDEAYEVLGKKNSADLRALSGRALATMALNESGTFSRAETAAAKLELRSRDRQSALSAIGTGSLTVASLTTYTRDLLAARESMSAEEQRLRESDRNLR